MRNIPTYLARHKVAQELGVSISTIKRWEKGGDFPVAETKRIRLKKLLEKRLKLRLNLSIMLYHAV